MLSEHVCKIDLNLYEGLSRWSELAICTSVGWIDLQQMLAYARFLSREMYEKFNFIFAALFFGKK